MVGCRRSPQDYVVNSLMNEHRQLPRLSVVSSVEALPRRSTWSVYCMSVKIGFVYLLAITSGNRITTRTCTYMRSGFLDTLRLASSDFEGRLCVGSIMIQSESVFKFSKRQAKIEPKVRLSTNPSTTFQGIVLFHHTRSCMVHIIAIGEQGTLTAEREKDNVTCSEQKPKLYLSAYDICRCTC